MSVKVTGLDKAVNAMKKADTKIARKALSKGLRSGAKLIQKEVMSMVPKSNAKKLEAGHIFRQGTGTLRKSIKVRVGKGNTKKGYVRFQVTTKGTPAFYASFLEAGTKYIKARHFMKRAADKAEARARNEISRAIKSAF
jgi:HK97 gp10 family phage protein